MRTPESEHRRAERFTVRAPLEARPPAAGRLGSYGQHGQPSAVDSLGIWLSYRQIRRHIGSLNGKRLGDFGSGFDAALVRRLLPRLASAVVVDLAVSDGVKALPRTRAIEGELPAVLRELPDASLDVVLCVSVLEHLWQPEQALAEFRRLLAPGGFCFVNVPSWIGKRFLEFSAFRLGLSPAEEMDDHKRYYDPRDLWTLLVGAGFAPSAITCRRHKFGLNTYALCRTG